jgi:hypothetical protein
LSADLLLLVTGEGHGGAAQIEPWRQVVQIAGQRLGNRIETFEWYAVVSVAPSIGNPLELKAASTVGPLAMEPTGKTWHEWIEPVTPSIFSREGFVCSPVVVRGISSGFTWMKAAEIAARDLRRLCGLLSVITDTPWRLRQVPAHPVPEHIQLPD